MFNIFEFGKKIISRNNPANEVDTIPKSEDDNFVKLDNFNNNTSEPMSQTITKTVTPVKDADKVFPDKPYGPKISNITNAGIEFYWKKVEIADGYEIFRSYNKYGNFIKIGETSTRKKGEYIDFTFDHSKKEVYYKSRSYLTTEDGTREYSEFTKAAVAVFRDNMILERDVTYMYDGTQRGIQAFYGWGEVTDAKWESSDESIAKISPEGIIYAIGSGETILTCSSESLGLKAITKVVVNRKSLEPLNTGTRRYSFNSETKHWESIVKEKTNDAIIMMTGDLMCGATQTKKQYNEEHGWSFNDSYEFVKTTTALSDFSIGNLETLMASGWPYMVDESYIDNKNNCNNPSRYLDAVLYGGFDAVTMSNNHNCDGGTRALLDTIDEVAMRKIPFTGIFKTADEPRFMIVNVNGIKIGFLAYMSRYTGFNGKDATWSKEEKDTLLNIFSEDKARKDIEKCKASGAEYIIAYMHWGDKNYKSITKKQEKEAQEIANAGADYIVGANPHMVQIYDEIITNDGKCVPCFYSTGNFQAYMNQIPGNRDSVMIRIRLKKNEDGKIILEENNYIPFHTFKELNGCYLAPLSVGKKYNLEVKTPGKSKYYNRIREAVGDKIKAL